MRASAGSKGSDFFSRKRTTASASSRLGGSVSKSSRTTRTEVSGRIAITSRDFPPTLLNELSIACRMALPSRRFASIKSGTTAPGASSRADDISTIRPVSAARPASTRSAAISQASVGRRTCLEVEIIVIGARPKLPLLQRWAQEWVTDLLYVHPSGTGLLAESTSGLRLWFGRWLPLPADRERKPPGRYRIFRKQPRISKLQSRLFEDAVQSTRWKIVTGMSR